MKKTGNSASPGSPRLRKCRTEERFRTSEILLKLRKVTMTDKLTCSSGGHLARTSPLPENGWDLTVSAASSLLTLYDYALKLEQGGYCGKMSPRHYQATTEKISQDLFLSSAAGTSLFHVTAGGSPGSLPEPPVISVYVGEFLTLNTPEFPNFQGRSRSEGSVSSLSDILVVGNIPPKYYLTVRCAEGILRRAERRGKDLPPVLKAALIRQSQSGCAQESLKAEEKAH